MADALLTLQSGNENLIEDTETGDHEVDVRFVDDERMENMWNGIVHFDIKSANSKSKLLMIRGHPLCSIIE